MIKNILYFIILVFFGACSSNGGSSDNSDTVVEMEEFITVDDLIQYQQDATTIVDEVAETGTLPNFNILAFEQLSDEEWDTQAVQKVLNIFAFGGFATDEQIQTWADMTPDLAIQEMLTFDESNYLLSPVDDSQVEKHLVQKDIRSLSIFWGSDHKNNPIPESSRSYYGLNDYWYSLQKVWSAKVNKRGFNPFREKIVFFETNYHMSLNQDNGINPQVMFQHYYNIAKTLENNLSYDKVLSVGALSAGIAYQYGHNRNQFTDGQFRGNEDFAREYHQLFFTIFGDYNSSVHEFETIRNTAKALTDMTGETRTLENSGLSSYKDVELSFNTEDHYLASLTILETDISGRNAKEKIFNLSKIAINHEESENNLPVYIVSTLADNNLTEEGTEKVISSWKQMGDEKYLLRFLQAYAVSKTFHSDTQFKYKTSVERNMFVLNKITINNSESYRDLYSISSISDDQNAKIFRPIHDVFGGQRSLEAIDSPDVFRSVYNRSTSSNWSILRNYITDDGESVWEKDFYEIIPKDLATTYDDNTTLFFVKDVASWLWNHLIQDNGENFGTLEKAHVYALLNGKDLGYFLNSGNPTKVYTATELESLETRGYITDGGNAPIYINSGDIDKRRTANRNILKAVAFIVATPYIYITK